MFFSKVYPAQFLRELCDSAGVIKGVSDESQIQPCSVDVRVNLGQEKLKIKAGETAYIATGMVIEKKEHYAIEYHGKSTTGRNFIKSHAHVEKNGNLLISVTPLLFDICIYNGDSLGQLVVHDLNLKSVPEFMPLSVDDDCFFFKCGRFQHESSRVFVSDTHELRITRNAISMPKNKCGIIQHFESGFGYHLPHVNAGFIDAGFDGKITYEVVNFENKVLPPDAPFANMVLIDLVEETDKPYDGNYQNSCGIMDMLPHRSFAIENVFPQKH